MATQTFRFYGNEVHDYRPAPPSVESNVQRSLEQWCSMAEARDFKGVEISKDCYIAELSWADDDDPALKQLSDILGEHRLAGKEIT